MRHAGWLGLLWAWSVAGCGGGTAPVQGGGPVRLEVSPAELTVAAGSVTQMTVQGRTAADLPVAVEARWAVDAAVGSVTTTGVFTATQVTSSAQPATGAVTVTADGLSATVPVTVLPGDAVTLTLSGPAGVALDALAPGQTVAVVAEAADRYGNLRRRDRFAVSPAWTLQGDVGVVDSAGLFAALRPGTGAIVATFGEATATLEVTVVLPSGVAESNGAVFLPGQRQTVTTAAGFELLADQAVDVPTTVLVEVVDRAAVNLPALEGTTCDPTGVLVATLGGALARPVELTVPGRSTDSAVASAPLIFMPFGDELRPLVFAPTRVTADTVTTPVPALVAAPANREELIPGVPNSPNLPAWMSFRLRTPQPTFRYQLGPMDQYASDVDGMRFDAGYGVGGSRSRNGWPAAGRAAVVIHGILSDPTVFQKQGPQGQASFAQFLAIPVADGGLGYDAVWGFHYDTRRHVAENAAILGELLARAQADEPATEVDLFCHSMGGLVARQMLEIVRPAGVRVDRVAMLGTPHAGSTLGGHGVAGAGGGGGGGWRQTAETALDPSCLLTESLPCLVVAASQAAAELSAGRSVQTSGILGGDGLKDLEPGCTFLQNLNGAPGSGGRVRPVYHAIAGDLQGNHDDLPGRLDLLYALRGILTGGTTNADVQLLFDEGDGCVLKDSALLTSLDDEAGDFDGLLRDQPALRRTLVGVNHLAMTTSQAVRDALLAWWTGDVDGIAIGIH